MYKDCNQIQLSFRFVIFYYILEYVRICNISMIIYSIEYFILCLYFLFYILYFMYISKFYPFMIIRHNYRKMKGTLVSINTHKSESKFWKISYWNLLLCFSSNFSRFNHIDWITYFLFPSQRKIIKENRKYFTNLNMGFRDKFYFKGIKK